MTPLIVDRLRLTGVDAAVVARFNDGALGVAA